MMTMCKNIKNTTTITRAIRIWTSENMMTIAGALGVKTSKTQ
jgi:hypothetical protein